ncbi:MAG: ABC transporter permease [Acidobacteria bacterium]|nr:ABC transporter permease [Acidobacteriota bacterium]
MTFLDLLRFVAGALKGQRLRSFLSALGVGIGVAAVILLTSLGEGTREYVVSQFTQFGTNLIGINPGKVKTMGMPGVFGGTTHKLTVDDAEALRRVPGVDKVIPVAMGQARVEGNGRGRSVYIYGVNHEATAAWKFAVAQGSFLPPMDPHRSGAFAVFGPRLARELFGASSPLGQRVRIGGWSFRVIGVMEPKGQLLGFDLDDAAYIPVGSAMALFNLEELNEIDVLAVSSDAVQPVKEGMRRLLMARHRGEDDFTITTQDEMLATFGRVIGIITVAVSGIGGISLLVGAMGILTIMWISVHERTAEIGVLRALGVRRSVIERLFLLESVVLAVAGGVFGLAAGFGIGLAARVLVPGLPVRTPPGAVAAAIVMSLVVGIASGWVPARRAAFLDPIEALREE